MSFTIKYGSIVFTNKIAEMCEPFCRKLLVNKNFVRTKNVAETMSETAFIFSILLTNAKSKYFWKSPYIICTYPYIWGL